MFNGNNIIKKNETGFVNHNNPFKKILNISLNLFEAEQTGILKGTNHTGMAFLPTENWDRGVMDKLYGKGIKGFFIKVFGKYIISLKKLSPVYFYKFDKDNKIVENDGMIAYVLRTCTEYYRKGISVIVVPKISEETLAQDVDYLDIPFYVYNGVQIKKSKERIKLNLNIVRHFQAKNCIFIFLPSYGILVINSGNETVLQFNGSSFTYEKEIINRLDVLIDLVETASLKYLSELKGKRGSELLWRKEKQLRNTSFELIEREKLYKDLYENAPNAYLTIDKNGIIIKCNKTIENLITYTKKELFGKLISEYFFNKEDQENTLKYFYELLKKENSIKDYEIEIKHKQNYSLWVSISIEAIKDIKDNLLEYRVIAADISKRKNAEKEKTKLEEQLRQSQKMEAVGTLAGGIAHDFNNILQAINGFTEIMILDRDETDPDYLHLSAIDKSVERAGQLIRKLLFFSRKAETEKKILKINNEILNAKSLLERTLPKMIEIELQLDGQLWFVTGDAVQIEQVFLNLGSNASDSMPDGGKIIIKSSNITFGEQLIQNQMLVLPGNYVQIDISDSGQGIDQDTLKHIFEPFFTTKEIGKGTGLGLASVYGIIKKHEGYIFCNSKIGIGSTFKIYLPAQIESDKYFSDKIIKKDKNLSVGTETILIIDDEFSILNFAFQALQRSGYKLFTVLSGEQAIELYSIKQKKIDLIILDVNMPGMGGKKCLIELLKINPDAKVIISSGHSIDGQKQILEDIGSVAYIAKPYKLITLSKTIRQVLDN
ncbi:MAG: PAS domain S-box protein [Desulfobacterales bacterium]|nr:PAS domain S-box protein [Desulfobacterales bacterium]